MGIATLALAAFLIYKISIDIFNHGFITEDAVLLAIALFIGFRGILRLYRNMKS